MAGFYFKFNIRNNSNEIVSNDKINIVVINDFPLSLLSKFKKIIIYGITNDVFPMVAAAKKIKKLKSNNISGVLVFLSVSIVFSCCCILR